MGKDTVRCIFVLPCYNRMLLHWFVQDVPCCALQLLAVGCLFLAAKQLEVRHQPPSSSSSRSSGSWLATACIGSCESGALTADLQSSSAASAMHGASNMQKLQDSWRGILQSLVLDNV